MPVGRNVVGEILAKRSVLCSLLSIMLNRKVKNLISGSRNSFAFGNSTSYFLGTFFEGPFEVPLSFLNTD